MSIRYKTYMSDCAFFFLLFPDPCIWTKLWLPCFDFNFLGMLLFWINEVYFHSCRFFSHSSPHSCWLFVCYVVVGCWFADVSSNMNSIFNGSYYGMNLFIGIVWTIFGKRFYIFFFSFHNNNQFRFNFDWSVLLFKAHISMSPSNFVDKCFSFRCSNLFKN